MDENKYADYLEILELEEEASLAEVKVAYKRLKKLYTAEAIESIVLEPLDDEFDEFDKMDILKSIEEAYEALSHYIQEKKLQGEAPTIKTKKPAPSEEKKSEKKDKHPKEKEDKKEPPKKEAKKKEEPQSDQIPLITPEGKTDEEIKEEIKELEIPDVSDEIMELPDEEELPPPGPSGKNLEDTIVEELKEPTEPPPMEKSPDETAEPFELHEEESETGDTVQLPDDLQKIENDIPRSKSKTVPRFDPSKTAPAIDSPDIVFKGRTLRKFREQKGVGIHELAISTKIHYRILVNIEKERYEELPEGGYVRWIVTTYAKALSLDPQKVAEDYMKRYRKWQRSQGQFV